MNPPANSSDTPSATASAPSSATASVPSRFLQRIAAYPEAVQEALRAEVTEVRLADYLRVLHDSPLDRSALTPGGNPILGDTMLSRLMTSKRFVARARQFEKLLMGSDPAAQPVLADYITGMIAPLADPDMPYGYKLAEAVNAEDLGGARASLAVLLDLIGLYRQVAQAEGPVALLLARLMRQAAQTGQTEVLNSTLAALGQSLVFRAQTAEPAEIAPAVSREMAVAFLRHVLRQRFDGPPALEPADTACLRAIQHMHALQSPTTLHPPLPLDLVLTGAATPRDEARWSAAQNAGLIRSLYTAPPDAGAAKSDADKSEPGQGDPHGVLTLQAAMQMSPIALAWLGTVGLPGGSLQIEARRQKEATGWARQIVGYLDDDEDALDVVGRYDRIPTGPNTSDGATGPHIVLAAPPAGAAAKGRRAPPALQDSYALVLRMDAKASPNYINIDCCTVFDSLEALTAACAHAPARLRKKPVVILGAASPAKPGHIIDSVAKFWAYGGRYITTNILLEYEGDTSKIAVSLPDQDKLVRLAAAAATTLPLDAILRDPAGIARQLASGVLVQSDGFGLCYHSNAPVGEEVLSRLQRDLGARVLGPADHERLFLVGTPDHVCLAPHDVVHNWPVEHLLSDILQKHQRLRLRLTAFPTAPDLQSARNILEHLDLRASETLNLAALLDDFLIALSQQPAMVLELGTAASLTLLQLARHTASSDKVAMNLAAYGQELCLNDLDLIIPLFEFLACALSPASLQATLSFAAMARMNNRKYLSRIAESIRRYGDEALVVQFLIAVKRSDPEALKENSFARNFQLVLDSPRLEVMKTLLGRDTLRHIRATIGFRHRFKDAVLAADRRAMQALVTDPVADFTPWMDGLRAQSNELRAMRLDNFAVPGISGLHRRKLAAAIFADKATLARFAAQSFLASDSDLDVISQHILGNGAPLNAMLARKCAQTGIAALHIEGDSTAAVFANAARDLAQTPQDGLQDGPQDGPLVSVIISAFNPDIELLELSLRSVLAQSHQQVEIFVVDDASTLASSQAIQALLKNFPNVDYTRLDVNCGPYIGRNLAIAKARGTFIAIQDADDWSHPARFASQIAAFAATPELRLVTTQHIRIDRFGGVQMEAGFTVCGDGPMTSMFRREVFDEIGSFAKIRSRGDVEMRERLRGYYGNHAICELEMPGMLCFADSATLSQKTKSEAAEYLQLFRSNISQRRSLANLRRDGLPLRGTYDLLVPMPLRPVLDGLADLDGLAHSATDVVSNPVAATKEAGQ